MTGWELTQAVDAWRHERASHFDGTDDLRAWVHELQRGAPSGGVVYPLGWWAAGCASQPNAKYRHVPPEQWAIVYDELQRGIRA